jgi:transcriptional regulator with XRE-family HTH domain
MTARARKPDVPAELAPVEVVEVVAETTSSRRIYPRCAAESCIRRACIDRGAERVTRESGLDASTIAKYLRGTRRPNIVTAIALLDRLGIPLESWRPEK